MNHRVSRQQGLTLISFLVLCIMVGFYILLGLKLLPIYLEHFQVTTIVKNLKDESDIAEKSPRDIMGMIQKRWSMNNIDRIAADKSISIEKTGSKITIDVDYEVEQPIVGNVSALVKFKELYTIGE
jgi:hypothetical protein